MALLGGKGVKIPIKGNIPVNQSLKIGFDEKLPVKSVVPIDMIVIDTLPVGLSMKIPVDLNVPVRIPLKTSALISFDGPLPVDAKPPTPQQPPPKEMANSSSLTGMSALSMNQNESLGLDIDEGNNMNASDDKNKQIMSLVNLLQEYMPSSDTDQTSPLGKQLNNMLLLRMLLLKPNRQSDEEEMVETMLVLYESYLAAGRTRPDLAILIARDYSFQVQHTLAMANLSQPQP